MNKRTLLMAMTMAFAALFTLTLAGEVMARGGGRGFGNQTTVAPAGAQRRDGSFLVTGTTANGSTVRPAGSQGGGGNFLSTGTTANGSTVRPADSQRRDGTFLSTGTTANGSTVRPGRGIRP